MILRKEEEYAHTHVAAPAAAAGGSHRSYQPTKPAASKLLQAKWDHKRYDEHKKKVSL